MLSRARGILKCMLAILAVLSLATASSPAAGKPDLKASDRDAIHAVHEAYRVAWLSNDAHGVRQTLSQNAVLLPHHGVEPVVGMEAINRFWWPEEGPPTTVTRFEVTYDEIDGNAEFGYVRGKSRVEWIVEEKGQRRKFSNAGTFLTLLRKQADGSWRITHQMWDDPPNQEIP